MPPPAFVADGADLAEGAIAGFDGGPDGAYLGSLALDGAGPHIEGPSRRPPWLTEFVRRTPPAPVVTTVAVEPDRVAGALDLNGFDWSGFSGQSLANMLGPADQVQMEITRTELGQAVQLSDRFFTRHPDGSLDKELLSDRDGRYELRIHRQEGDPPRDLVDSQVFFEGHPDDTVITKSHLEDGWAVSRTGLFLKDLKPEGGLGPDFIETREKLGATPEDLAAAMAREPLLEDLAASDAYKAFMASLPPGQALDIQATTTQDDDNGLRSSQVVVRAGAATLVLTTDGAEAGSIFRDAEATVGSYRNTAGQVINTGKHVLKGAEKLGMMSKEAAKASGVTDFVKKLDLLSGVLGAHQAYSSLGKDHGKTAKGVATSLQGVGSFTATSSLMAVSAAVNVFMGGYKLGSGDYVEGAADVASGFLAGAAATSAAAAAAGLPVTGAAAVLGGPVGWAIGAGVLAKTLIKARNDSIAIAEPRIHEPRRVPVMRPAD